MTVTRGPRTWIDGVVPDRPFCAEIRELEFRSRFFRRRSWRQVVRGTISRDSKGRVRNEYELGKRSRAISIVDPVERKMLVLDLQREIYFSTAIQYRIVEAKLPREIIELPAQVIEGLECRQLSRVLPDGTTIDADLSVDLLIPIRERVARPDVEVLWELTRLSRAEPDPSLFTVPAGYTLIDPT